MIEGRAEECTNESTKTRRNEWMSDKNKLVKWLKDHYSRIPVIDFLS